MRLEAYNDTEIRQSGMYHIDLHFKSKRMNAKFFVVVLYETDRTDRQYKTWFNNHELFYSVSNTGDIDTEIESHNSSEYFSGNAETKCQDKVTSYQFKTAILQECKEYFFLEKRNLRVRQTSLSSQTQFSM